MKDTMNSKVDCKTCSSHLPDVLLDDGYLSRHGDVAAHIRECAACRAELHEIRATFALLDAWHAPEPSPYFDAKLHARLREATEAAPEGLWNRLRSYLMYSTERGLRPAMAGALAVVLVLGGGGTLIGF